MDLGKKRVEVVDSNHTVGDDAKILLNKNIDQSPELLSPERFEFALGNGHSDVLNHNNLQRTPKTACVEERVFESRLESLPIDLLVKILCHLRHDQVRSVFHVSEKNYEGSKFSSRVGFDERQNFANTLYKNSKECENLLKNETAKFQETFEKFCKEKAMHLQALKDVISKYEEEKE